MAFAALEAVELAGGEAEQAGGFGQGEVVPEAEGAEAGAEVAGAEVEAEQEVKGVAVVVCVLAEGVGPFDSAQGLRCAAMEEEGGEVGEGVEQAEERVGVGGMGAGELGEVALELVRGKESAGQAEGGAGRKSAPSYALWAPEDWRRRGIVAGFDSSKGTAGDAQEAGELVRAELVAFP